jgi:hypothetical protein
VISIHEQPFYFDMTTLPDQPPNNTPIASVQIGGVPGQQFSASSPQNPATKESPTLLSAQSNQPQNPSVSDASLEGRAKINPTTSGPSILTRMGNTVRHFRDSAAPFLNSVVGAVQECVAGVKKSMRSDHDIRQQWEQAWIAHYEGLSENTRSRLESSWEPFVQFRQQRALRGIAKYLEDCENPQSETEFDALKFKEYCDLVTTEFGRSNTVPSLQDPRAQVGWLAFKAFLQKSENPVFPLFKDDSLLVNFVDFYGILESAVKRGNENPEDFQKEIQEYPLAILESGYVAYIAEYKDNGRFNKIKVDEEKDLLTFIRNRLLAEESESVVMYPFGSQVEKPTNLWGKILESRNQRIAEKKIEAEVAAFDEVNLEQEKAKGFLQRQLNDAMPSVLDKVKTLTQADDEQHPLYKLIGKIPITVTFSDGAPITYEADPSLPDEKKVEAWAQIKAFFEPMMESDPNFMATCEHMLATLVDTSKAPDDERLTVLGVDNDANSGTVFKKCTYSFSYAEKTQSEPLGVRVKTTVEQPIYGFKIDDPNAKFAYLTDPETDTIRMESTIVLRPKASENQQEVTVESSQYVRKMKSLPESQIYRMDLDSSDLVKYLEKPLMEYIRTSIGWGKGAFSDKLENFKFDLDAKTKASLFKEKTEDAKKEVLLQFIKQGFMDTSYSWMRSVGAVTDKLADDDDLNAFFHSETKGIIQDFIQNWITNHWVEIDFKNEKTIEDTFLPLLKKYLIEYLENGNLAVEQGLKDMARYKEVELDGNRFTNAQFILTGLAETRMDFWKEKLVDYFSETFSDALSNRDKVLAPKDDIVAVSLSTKALKDTEKFLHQGVAGILWQWSLKSCRDVCVGSWSAGHNNYSKLSFKKEEGSPLKIKATYSLNLDPYLVAKWNPNYKQTEIIPPSIPMGSAAFDLSFEITLPKDKDSTTGIKFVGGRYHHALRMPVDEF